jgi:hypothetical protein
MKILEIIKQLFGEENGFKQIPKWIWVVVVILAVWAMFHIGEPSDSWNVRMTVEIATPEGVKTGSSVWRIHHDNEPQILPNQSGAYYVDRGEAIEIDLGRRGIVFALLRGADLNVDYSHVIAFTVFPLGEKTPPGTVATLAPQQFPLFVHFKNMDDPRTVETVYGDILREKAIPSNNLFQKPTEQIRVNRMADVFGSGVAITSVSMEVTKDSPKLALQRILPWLSSLHGHLSGSTISGMQLFQYLSVDEFQRGK